MSIQAAPAPNGIATAAQFTSTGSITLHSGGLSVRAYRGDGSVMLVMSLDRSRCEGLAGFAIAHSADGGHTWRWAANRLSFNPAKAVTAATDPNEQLAAREGSYIAPYQKFHWVDFPAETAGTMQYRVVARYFVPGKDPAVDAPKDALTDGPAVTFAVDTTGATYANFRIGFTRGYISSQAFADMYPNVKALRPPDPVVFDEKAAIFTDQSQSPTWIGMYQWLGAHARTLLVEFTQACSEKSADLDVFAYDLDEPSFLNFLGAEAQRGRTVRMLLDDSKLHTKPGAKEIAAAAFLAKAGVQIERGHFERYAHDKCVIAKDRATGKPFSVLTGSANFSVRGLYVQSNSIVVIDDPATAVLYGQAFEEAWSDMKGFQGADIASQWFDGPQNHAVPTFAVSFAPHTDASISLGRVAQAIGAAKSSVLFAVMELGGGGPVLDALRNIQKNDNIFSYGITQTVSGLKFYKSKTADGLLVPFDFLDRHVPEPFKAEWRGGMGQVIHHKFVVIDFNEADPVVFCGSSNLAQGGEEQNGDNLIEIRDPALAALYAIEAIKLVDHYEFRAMQSQAQARNALSLAGPKASPAWWESSFDPASIKNRERIVFAG